MRASETDAAVAVSAAVAGAAVVRAAYGAVHVRHAKSGTDFATEADLEAEAAILGVIGAARPGDTLVGEESGETRGSTSRRWLVDPLCGTLNFAAQTPLLAVNVALLDGSSCLAAVSVDPVSDELFWTDGDGAFVRRDGSDVPLRPSPESQLVDVNCDGPPSSVGPRLVADPAFRAAFGTRVLSTTLALAWVAAGRRAGYVTDGVVTDNVHFAAGLALCQSAGCVVTDLAGQPLDSGRGLVAAADAETHRRLAGLVAPHLGAAD